MYSEKLSFNSDLPIDKIVYLKEGELTTDSNGAWNLKENHGLAAVPFLKGIWTMDDWANTYIVGTQRIDDSGQYYTDQSYLYSMDKQVIFTGYASKTNTKLKYKLWGVWNETDTYSSLAEFTHDKSNNRLVIDTSYDYPQLVKEGYLNKGETLTHSLGFIPYLDVWAYVQVYDPSTYTSLGYGWQELTNDGFGTGYGSVQISKNTLKVDTSGYNVPDKIYYRLYV